MKTDRTTCVARGESKRWRFPSCVVTALAFMIGVVGTADLRGATPAPVNTPTPSVTEEKITLSPFEVVADAGDTYDATNTNSITGTNLDLNKTPLSAKIFNRTFMDELGVTDVGNMLGTFGGLGLPLFGSGSDAQRGMQEGDAVDYKAMTSRGLKISNPRRDGFLRSDVSLADSFDVESAEAVQGSNSLLFGSGDAGGVININSKRARLNQRSLAFAAKWDSEGSLRYTTDINVGTNKFAVRINGMKAKDLYYRPIIMQKQEGLQVAATLKPFHWLSVSGEYRYYLLDHILAGNATIRTPPTMLLSNGQSMDNMSVRYITGLGGSAALGNFITLRNQDSISGAFLRHYYTVGSYSVVVAATPLKDLHFQFRYGDDQRTNGNPSPTNQILYHPRAAGNLAPIDASGNRPWALNTSSTAVARTEGSNGYKVSGSYRRNLGRWGDHWINAFVSQQENTSIGTQYRFVETDANGKIIFQGPLLSANSGQILMPDAWVPAFSETVFGRLWPTETLVHPQNGKTYRWAKTVYPGTVAPRVGNPLGTSGAIPAAGGRPAGYSSETTHERSKAISLSSEFWGGRVNTMAGFRFDNGDFADVALGSAAVPADYHSSTVGAVFDTPVKGIRAYASHSTNALASFGIARDIYDEPLPIGRGITREAGLKFSMFDHRVSGNIAYYVSEAKNFSGTIAALDYDRIDPNGVNGRNGGNGFSYNKKSNGLDVALSMRPLNWWQVRLNYTEGDGREGTDVRLPVFYNDEFNTTTANGQTVVGVKNPTSGALTPYMVPSIPGNASSPQIALSVAMLRDRNSPYFATLDRDSGQILNASSLGLLGAGIGTGRTGLAISNHQLGFVPPADTIIVRKAGERTTGYPEHSVSIINRFQVTEGRLRGAVLGLATVYQTGIRGYMYTDAASAGQRKIFFYPDRIENSVFAIYSFKPIRKMRPTLQVNISNLFDKQRVIALPNSTTGAIRYFAYQYSPTKFSVTSRLSF